MKRIATLLLFTIITISLPISALASETVADGLMKGNKLVAVVVVLAIILSGILSFLWTLERRVRKMEEEINP